MKKMLCLFLMCCMIIGTISGCSKGNENNTTDNATNNATNNATTGSDAAVNPSSTQVPPLAETKPVLKMIIQYTAADMNNDPAKKRMEELTGYTTEFEVLPVDNPNTQLMLEVSSGTDANILRVTSEQYGLLKAQGALEDLTPYLDAYGSDLKTVGTEFGWAAVTGENGEIFGLPYESGATMEEPYGTIQDGIIFRSDILAELNLEVPTTLDGLYNTLLSIKEAKGVAPLTIAGGNPFAFPVLGAFDIGIPEWYDVNGNYVPRIRMEKMDEYLAYMQKLYKDGLLDAEFPINKTQNTIEKLSNNNAYATTLYFWDIPTLVDSLKAVGADTQLEMAGRMKQDDNTAFTSFVSKGLNQIFCIPKGAENVADAVNYINLLSNPDNFLGTYLGEEGVQYEVKDDKYYPLFPGFNDFANSKQFTGIAPNGVEFKYWQARARKTPEMAKAYDEMNSKIPEGNIVLDISGFGLGQEAALKNRASLNTMISDSLINAIVEGTDPQAAIADIITQWEAMGGLDYEKEMQTWYSENKSLIK
jgi:putative aldouronate transport system substrate-binding protein